MSPQHASPREGRSRRALVPGHEHAHDHDRLGEEAMHFGKWFAQSKYRLMGRFLGELVEAPQEREMEELRERYGRALTHGQRVHRMRGVVTVLLAIGAGTAAGSAIADALLLGDLLAGVAAIAGSLTVGLLLLRLAFDRYLERVDVTATFLAIQLARVART